jgi:hypothetical protein
MALTLFYRVPTESGRAEVLNIHRATPGAPRATPHAHPSRVTGLGNNRTRYTGATAVPFVTDGPPSASSAVSGRAMSSRLCRSAFTEKKIATIPAAGHQRGR